METLNWTAVGAIHVTAGTIPYAGILKSVTSHVSANKRNGDADKHCWAKTLPIGAPFRNAFPSIILQKICQDGKC
eukprot:CAMPEP_0175052012 /NCGR_PEP_ID=MMETSP0052_2-20121109/8126_1 /TAXON_ID=51329 ORGANISM="Polytomella parva, Strain SAG 63-3" /NCGR_SAMPLE_ID=MMETSP0052_2 /ASSEMBLY_ACC=CAM_ASM_000194 /LENGTH=74 /DNA_ID=CAMNT_0016316375 /DNA_START=1003 /DNA_END=1227 /DNA_ORIENTATION=+